MKKFLFLCVVIALSCFGCQSKSDQDYFDLAVQYQKDGKYTEAIASYEKAAQEFPDGKIASSALFEAGKLYQSRIIKNLPPRTNSLKAVEEYEKVYKNYPNSAEAPKALFMIGFIQANELFQYAEAKRTFNSFIETYPKHELAYSAEMELQNIGKSPEEVFRTNSGKL